MERQENRIASIFLIFLLMSVIVPASAVSVSFVDSSYLEQNDYLITDNYETTVANFTGDSTVTLNGGRSYNIDFRPRGLFDLTEQQPEGLTVFDRVFPFLSQNLAALIVLFAVLFVAAKWRGHS